jgi:hypothetical protein
MLALRPPPAVGGAGHTARLSAPHTRTPLLSAAVSSGHSRASGLVVRAAKKGFGAGTSKPKKVRATV